MNKPLVWKLMALAALALVLEFALGQVQGKVRERQATRDGAIKAIAEQYAKEQRLLGPLLWVHCQETRKESVDSPEGKKSWREVVQDCSQILRPTKLQVHGKVDVAQRHRGIYKARVYLAQLRMQVQFPGFALQPGQTGQGARLVVGVQDPRGIKRIRVTDNAGALIEALPGVPPHTVESGFQLPVGARDLVKGFALELDVELAGTARLDLVPIASENVFGLNSNWPHPSFTGHFLPETPEISASGFAARWRVNDFATGGEQLLKQRGHPSSLGVSLLDPVDAYTQSDRAVRYGFLFVLLTLGGFLLFEWLQAKPLHPLQHGLVGFAVVTFFLLLLALSEHLTFAVAYLIAAGACVVLLGTYGRTLLGSWQAACILALSYSLLYFCLYQLLASEDYALLLGAGLIFALLALTMYLTRRLSWRQLGASTAGTPQTVAPGTVSPDSQRNAT